MENVSVSSGRDGYPFASIFPNAMESMCPDGWLPSNHFLFQLANAFLFLSYLAPPGMYGLLYLRATLLLGCIFFGVWGLVILCALDTFMWNAVFTLLNFIHLCVLCYMLRPVRLTPEQELVYKDYFMPLHVSRRQFKKAINCMREIQTLKPHEAYCIEKVTKVEQLSLVLSGRLVVSQNGRILHVIDSRQFLDSPEWFGVCTGEYYQVSITVVEESRVLIWHRDKLKLSISDDKFLQSVFDNILGRDVVKKLMLVTESACNGINLHIYDDATTETAKLLSKYKESPTGLSVLLNRQIGSRDFNVWNVAKFTDREYLDVETTV